METREQRAKREAMEEYRREVLQERQALPRGFAAALRGKGKVYQPNGKREVARRNRQAQSLANRED